MMKQLFAFFLLFSFSGAILPVQTKAEPADKTTPSIIRPTPPAPRFTDAERQTELAARRARVFAEMPDKSMLVLFSAEPKIYTNDVDFMYRQENNLYYLTNLKQNGATLVLVKNGGASQEFLFLPKRIPQFEAWNGRMYSNEEAMRISGLKTLIDAAETKDFLESLKNRLTFTAKTQTSIPSVENIYFLLPGADYDNDGKREFRKEIEFVKTIAEASVNATTREITYTSAKGYKINNAQPIFGRLRFVKSPYELKLMQHAIDITTEAQMRSMGMVGKAKFEYEVQAEVEYIFRRRNADYWGYPSIVGCGPNATTLHYVESQSEIKPGELLLMDVGAEYDHYTADVTRTYPVNGKFSKEQAEIYQLVYEAQEAVAKLTRPGARFGDLDDAAEAVAKKGLLKLGLITGEDDLIPSTVRDVPDGKGGTRKTGTPQYRLWYMHGLGHWVGMNVHDVGEYDVPLKAGAIFTNEPGIYFREDMLDNLPDTPANREFIAKVRPAFEKYKNIGVRIEDDMLVTESGVEWMTKALPRKLSEIESFMAKASKEVNVAARHPEANPTLAFFGEDADFPLPASWNANFFDLLNPPTGKTVRRGWIYAGKEAAYSSLNHAD